MFRNNSNCMFWMFTLIQTFLQYVLYRKLFEPGKWLSRIYLAQYVLYPNEYHIKYISPEFYISLYIQFIRVYVHLEQYLLVQLVLTQQASCTQVLRRTYADSLSEQERKERNTSSWLGRWIAERYIEVSSGKERLTNSLELERHLRVLFYYC